MIATVVAVYIVPRSLNVIIPAKRREEGNRAYAPQVLCGLDDIRVSQGIEAHSEDRSSDSDGVPMEKSDGRDLYAGKKDTAGETIR